MNLYRQAFKMSIVSSVFAGAAVLSSETWLTAACAMVAVFTGLTAIMLMIEQKKEANG